MDRGDGKHSDFDRRASIRVSIRHSVALDGDFDENRASRISDDLRPTQSNSQNGSRLDGHAWPRPHTATPDMFSHVRPNTAPERPSSTSKPPQQIEPPTAHAERVFVASQPPPATPSTTTMDDAPIIETTQPYSGPSGPSHPYQMYPQRATSISTVRSNSVLSDTDATERHVPAHPYGLYPQDVSSNDDPSQASTLSVGFPGMSDGYQRRIGPEGEEAGGLIGPLGHTEELPPYTRYPDATTYATKSVEDTPSTTNPTDAEQPAPLVAEASVAPAPAPMQPIPGAGGIGLATRDPEYSSMSDLDSPRSRLSTRSFTSENSRHEINTAAHEISEKSFQNKWEKRAKKKIWGVVPYWAICLLAVALVLMGVILGAVIGTFLVKHQRGSISEEGSRQGDSKYGRGVRPLAEIPDDLPPLEIGSFSLPPLIASLAPSTCFNITTQAQAWTCNMPLAFYTMEVQRIPNEPAISEYSLRFSTVNNTMMFSKYMWGTRPPLIPDPVQLTLVNDTAEPGWGPAWWLQIAYNKTVVISEDRFPGSATARRIKRNPPQRDASNSTGDGEREPKGDFKPDGGGKPPDFKSNDFMKKGVPLPAAKEGDKAWICNWPGTVLEFFIYPRQNNSYTVHAGTTTWSNNGFMYPTPTRSSTSSSLTTEATSATSLTSAITTTATASPPWPKSDGTGFDPSLFPFPDDSKWEKMKPPPQAYPKIIKISEKRVTGGDENVASCMQIKVIDDGQDAEPVLDEEGNPIEVIIPEKRRLILSPTDMKLRLDPRGILLRDTAINDPGDCGCIWMFE